MRSELIFCAKPIRVQVLVGCVLLALMLCGELLVPSSAQNRSSKSRTSQSKKATARPSPSPTRSILDLLGEPPPLPSPTPVTNQDINPGDVISIETTEVMIPVSVRDANGRFVTHLTRDDFKVFEEEQLQPL